MPHETGPASPRDSIIAAGAWLIASASSWCVATISGSKAILSHRRKFHTGHGERAFRPDCSEWWERDPPNCGTREMTMIRKLILGSAAVMALGLAGAALDFSADADDVPNASENTATMLGTSYQLINAANLSKDDIRWAQVELHYKGLYNGSLDGVIGPQTKRALALFQKSNGLERTATLDQQTADALVGNPEIGQGSSSVPRPREAAHDVGAACKHDECDHWDR
jgi:hypothetical protein